MTDNLTFDSHERAEMQGTSPRLAVSGISKRYGVVQALDDVSFDVSAGQIHALVGENGSGKSTVVGIISGTVQPDAGVISIDGGAVTSRRTADSQRAGAITVFQDGSLIKDLSVAQNLYLGTDRAQRPAYRRIVAWATELLASHGIRIDPTMKAGDLAPGDRQLLEIIRAISREPKILILDEATSALDAQGVDTVLLLMRQVASRGTAVLFVTHRLSEVERVADTVTVLRDGRYQGTHDAPTTALQRLVELMAGTRVDMEFPERSDQSNGKVLLQAKDLAGPGFGPVDVELRAGEIVGIAGADGNGQLALLRGLASLGETHGHVRTGGTSIRSYRMAVERGVVLLGSDRKNESLFSALSVGDNIGIGVLGRLSSMGFMRLKRERSFIEDSIEEYRIRVGNPRQLPSELSGGNQQKVALSRVLAMDPRVVLIDEPTQGVDVRSRMDIYRLLRQVADKGHAVVVVSSDASELAGMCDRVLVMSRGRLTAELPGLGVTEEQIVGAFAIEHAADPGAVLDSADQVVVDGPADRPRRFAGIANRETMRVVALAALVVCLTVFAQAKTGSFTDPTNLYILSLVLFPIAAVSAAQYFVLLVGGIDVSVGAAMTLAVVLMSSWATAGSVATVLLAGAVVALVLGVVVGGVNTFLVERLRIVPVIATIATMGIVGGVCYMLRPTPSGAIAPALGDALMLTTVGPIPAALVVLGLLFVVVDVVLRNSGAGLRMRAVGLDSQYADRLGVPARRVRVACYLLCSALAGVGGVILAAQVGVGDPNVGSSFTLLSIAAPILGGAALQGGRGLLIGSLLGTVVLVISQNLVTLLALNDGVSLVLPGVLTLLALMSSSDGAVKLWLWRARPRGHGETG